MTAGSAAAAAGRTDGSRERTAVLGSGGVVGTAWTAGLAGGLARAGADLAEADLIIGTSAGAVIGALLATGQRTDHLAAPAESDVAPPRLDERRMAEVFAVLEEAGPNPAETRRRAGKIALAADTGPEEYHIARMTTAVGGEHPWPQGKLLIMAVEAESGRPTVFSSASRVPLPLAVAASTAFPGIYPPVTLKGRRYMDGALRSGTNADLAVGARVLVVVEPLAHMFPREQLTRELAAAGAQDVVTIVPDPDSLRAFGPDLHDGAAWQPAYREGLRQGAEEAERVRAVWGAARATVAGAG